ncbi:MAG: selenocysteine-specific translation elongation factor, partial [Clostridia bacterium]|nr:selenocysteine-specific translation elongation factor [Clostridia bacterium]
MKHIIVGTAGHVDHGKTSLIKALTGIETDRLKAEKERGISIELGFASLDLGDLKIGLVDVPGHEKFIKNMLAGAGGMDLVLLVIAADEGIMPQTKEHLDILRFLQIKKGIVVLTKVDLVEEDWLEMVREEVQEFLEGTFLFFSPLLEASAVTGQGLEELKRLLREMALAAEDRSSFGTMRMPIDRVFSITGFGTVVTGTLASGTVKPGEMLEVLPEGLSSRVRSVQVHNQKVEKAMAGQRVAVNLADLEVNQINRGSVLAAPQAFQAVYRLDVKLSLLKEVEEIKNRTRVRVHLGTAEVLGRIIWLEGQSAKGGEVVYAQLVLEEPLVAAKGDRLVIRSYSPVKTIGGGQVLDPQALKHKASEGNLLEKLQVLEKGTPEELLFQFLLKQTDLLTKEEIKLELTDLESLLADLVGKEQLKIIEGKYYLASELYQLWQEQTLLMLQDYLQQFPLREGCPREEVRQKICPGVNQKKFARLVQDWQQAGCLQVTEKALTLPDYHLNPESELGLKAAQIRAAFQAGQFQPP